MLAVPTQHSFVLAKPTPFFEKKERPKEMSQETCLSVYKLFYIKNLMN